MKKLLVSTVLLLTFTVTYAQLNFGIKAGYNSLLTFDNISSVGNGSYNLSTVQAEMWNNFQAGLFARIGFGKVIYVQPELLYSIEKKNYQVTFQDVTAGNVTLDKFANISTVDVPILLGAKLLDLKLLNLRVFAGPKLRFNAGSTFDFQNITGGNFDTSKIVSDVKAANLGLEVGAGIDVLMFALDVRYNLIGDMYTTKIGDINLQNLPSNTFVISLGWKIL
jgi:hypothetical protein